MRPDRRSPSPGLCFPDLVDGGQLPDQRHSRGGYQSWPLNCQRGGVRTDLASMSVRLYGRVVGCVLVGWRARDRRACPWSCSDIARCLAPKADLRANHGRAVWAERALQHGPEGTSYAARRPLTARGERTKERPSLASGFDTPAETLAKVQDLLCPILCPFLHTLPTYQRNLSLFFARPSPTEMQQRRKAPCMARRRRQKKSVTSPKWTI